MVSDALGALRLKLGQDLQLLAGGWRPLWVTDFPMFEWDAQERRWVAMHHPFTSPVNDDPAALRAAPAAALARAYDMVLNGSEIGGGSVRIPAACNGLVGLMSDRNHGPRKRGDDGLLGAQPIARNASRISGGTPPETHMTAT